LKKYPKLHWGEGGDRPPSPPPSPRGSAYEQNTTIYKTWQRASKTRPVVSLKLQSNKSLSNAQCIE